MSYYIILNSLSEQGIENIKNTPERADNLKKICEKNGVKIHGIYYTFGQYDVVVIVEAPNDDAMLATLLAKEMDGAGKSITLKAFTFEEAEKIISNL